MYVYPKEYWKAEQADYEMEIAWQRACTKAQALEKPKPSPFNEAIVIARSK